MRNPGARHVLPALDVRAVRHFYCDVSTLNTYEVKILPDDRQDPRVEQRKRLIRIHDVDRDVNAWYGVPPERLGRSKRQAIIAAREDLKDKRRELEDEIAARQQDQARIDSMLELE